MIGFRDYLAEQPVPRQQEVRAAERAYLAALPIERPEEIVFSECLEGFEENSFQMS